MSKTVLFVDDDEVFLELLNRATRGIPEIVSTIAARDGSEGLAVLRERLYSEDPLPDLILLDINMPVLDGFGFLRAFARMCDEYPELKSVRPVTMLTSSDQERDRELARELGAHRYIVKGSTMAEIRAGVVECL